MNENQTIFANIRRHVDLSAEDEGALSAILMKRRVKKRQFIVQPGFVCAHQSYVEKGAFRAYFIHKNGAEHTIQFAIEDWFISDFNSYISQTPASLFVEALEDGLIMQMEYNAVEMLCAQNPIFERYFRMIAQKSFAFAQRRILSNLGQTAAERFRDFNKLYPEIVRRVPQYMLASYLGMTPEFLSKTRKSLNRES
ncbi:MAG: Crp/Fnr family transcriptional regulator [Calditrichaeota bacterium]|nr:MAG: Crp/Fnr family transcriptional regulator [Calditrichota bacterium]